MRRRDGTASARSLTGLQIYGALMNRIRSIRYLLAAVLIAWLGAAHADGPALGRPAPEFKLQDQNGKWHTA